MYQKTVIVGNLGRDPEMRYTPKGTPVTQLSVATTRKWYDASGALMEETAWFRVHVFGKRAEVCNQYLAKGRKVLVEGNLVVDEKTGGPRVWQRKDGTYGASFELRATDVKFLSPRTQGNGTRDEDVAEGGMESVGGMTEEELPF